MTSIRSDNLIKCYLECVVVIVYVVGEWCKSERAQVEAVPRHNAARAARVRQAARGALGERVLGPGARPRPQHLLAFET